MAAVWQVNNTPVSQGAELRAFLNFLIANGALSHLESGDGVSTVSSGADVFNPTVIRSWGRYSLLLWGAPREITLQSVNDGTGTPGRRIRCKYSRAAGFTSAPTGGGVKSATRTPSASDEQFWAGGSTDAAEASGWGRGWLGATPASYRTAYMVDTATKVAYFLCWTFVGGAFQCAWVFDAIKPNTIDPSDGDPFTAYWFGNSFNDHFKAEGANAGLMFGSGSIVGNDNASAPAGWWKYGLGGAGFVPCSLSGPFTFGIGIGVQLQPWRTTVDVVTGVDVLSPASYWRDQVNAAPNGYHGDSTIFRWQSALRANMSTLSVASVGAKDYVAAVHCALPWNGSTPALSVAPTDYAAKLLYPAGASPDTTKPVVTVISPAPGTEIGPNDPLIFDVTDNVSSFRRIVVETLVASLGLNEVAHNGDTFRPTYAPRSSRTAIVNGYRYTLYRAPCWPGSPGLEVYAIDTAGNEND